MSSPIDIPIKENHNLLKCTKCHTYIERRYIYICTNCRMRFCDVCALNFKVCKLCNNKIVCCLYCSQI